MKEKMEYKECKACQYATKTKDFTSTQTGEKFDIKETIRCTDKGLIYLIECSCKRQYLGEITQSLRERIRENLSCIKNGKHDAYIYKHFRVQVHNNNPKHWKFWGIQKVRQYWKRGNLEDKLLYKGAELIYKMKTLQPYG